MSKTDRERTSDEPDAGGTREPTMVYVSEHLHWEYKLVDTDADGPDEATLERLGASGWELAAIVARASGMRCYLKRERV